MIPEPLPGVIGGQEKKNRYIKARSREAVQNTTWRSDPPHENSPGLTTQNFRVEDRCSRHTSSLTHASTHACSFHLSLCMNVLFRSAINRSCSVLLPLQRAPKGSHNRPRGCLTRFDTLVSFAAAANFARFMASTTTSTTTGRGAHAPPQQMTADATRLRDPALSSGTRVPIWLREKDVPRRQFSPLSSNMETDVCVIGICMSVISPALTARSLAHSHSSLTPPLSLSGGGISGLTCANTLTRSLTLTHTLTHSLRHSFTTPLTHSLSHSHSHSITH